MPAPVKLEGRRFGRMTVVARDGHLIYGLRMSAWRCLCDCGVEFTVPRARIPYYPSIAKSSVVDACPACRLARRCAQCGEPFVPPASRSITCSPACSEARRSTVQREGRPARDAANHAGVRAAHARYRARIAADPVRAERQREARKTEYALRRDEMNRVRRERRAAETPAQKAERVSRLRAYLRAWHAQMRDDPERRARYLALQTEARRKSRLAELVALGATLQDMT